MALFRRSTPNALTAAARSADEDAQIRGTDGSPQYAKWQDEAWAMYDGLGEFRRGVTWKAEVVSRARLVAAYAPDRQGDEPTPIESKNDPAIDLVNNIAGGLGGQASLLRSMTVHLDVPGEGWLIAEAKGEHGPTISWTVYAADDVKTEKNRTSGSLSYFVRTGTSAWRYVEDCVPIRIWRPHERHAYEPDSTARASLPIMRRLELLNRHVDAQAASRLASNGMYWVANEITFPKSDRFPDAEDPFMADFMYNMMTAIKTPGSAAAAIPIVNRIPHQYIKDGIRYDSFSSAFDQKVLDLREFEVRRLATSIDVPPEVLLGMVDVNHWGAWQIEESALKTTVASTIELICWALTSKYLQPALDAMRRPVDQDADDGRRRIVWYDLSELAVRPDRSQDAIKLADELIISTDALIRETGFDNSDLLDDEDEMRKRVGLSLISSGVPANVPYGLALLGLGALPQGTPIDIIGDVPAVGPPLEVPPSRQPSGNGDQPGAPITQDNPSGRPTPRPTQAATTNGAPR